MISTEKLRRLHIDNLILGDKLIFSYKKRCDAKFSFLLDPEFLFFLSEGDLAAGVSATAVQVCGKPRLPGHPGLWQVPRILQGRDEAVRRSDWPESEQRRRHEVACQVSCQEIACQVCCCCRQIVACQESSGWSNQPRLERSQTGLAVAAESGQEAKTSRRRRLQRQACTVETCS